ncbi:Arginyl-tRNA synthetase [Blyttiomyces sp. JEL0837]|nr:Arginyl-tRNA synthetase [Blyttiomyces sp. JEL0837]
MAHAIRDHIIAKLSLLIPTLYPPSITNPSEPSHSSLASSNNATPNNNDSAILLQKHVNIIRRHISSRLRFCKRAKVAISLSSVLGPINWNELEESFAGRNEASKGKSGAKGKEGDHDDGEDAGLDEEEFEDDDEEEEEEEDQKRAQKGKVKQGHKSDQVGSVAFEAKMSLFEKVKHVASKWEPDELIVDAEANGSNLVLTINSLKLIQHIVAEVVDKKSKYGWDNVHIEGNPSSAVVEFDLPGLGHPLDANAYRAILTASFVYNCLNVAGVPVESRCRIRVWSIETGLILLHYKHNPNPAELESNTLPYLYHLLTTYQSRTNPNHNILVRQAQHELLKLHQGDQDTITRWNTLHAAWARATTAVIKRYGCFRLSLKTDEVLHGLKEFGIVLERVISKLQKGHPEAPLAEELDDEDDDDDRGSEPRSEVDDVDDDEKKGKAAGVNGTGDGGESLSPAIVLDLRVGGKFGVAKLTHRGGAPTPLAVDLASAIIRRGLQTDGSESDKANITYAVMAWSKHYRVQLTRRCLELLGEPWDSTRFKEVPHSRLLGLETRVSDGFPSPLRWLKEAEDHLKHVSGKSAGEVGSSLPGRSMMVFRTEEEDEVETVVDETGLEAEYAREISLFWEGPGAGVGTLDDTLEKSSSPEIVGAGAVAIQVLQSKRTKDCYFDWTRILNCKKDLGLYLEYAHARLCGIQRKTGIALDVSADLSLLVKTPHAVDLASILAQYPATLASSAKAFDPSVFIPQIVALARIISSGHNSMFVRGRPDNIARARMLLLWCAKVVIASALRLLGVTPMERM